MTELFPSYLQKVSRAEKHLIELEMIIDAWVESRPYGVVTRREGKRQVRRVAFRSLPENTDIPIVAADVIYNLRSGLDHVACALVPSKNRYSVYFPIMWKGVWEPDVRGEKSERSKNRSQWNTYTREMPDQAIAILRELQPPDNVGEPSSIIDTLRFLNALSNRDRHTKLPIIAPGLQNVTMSWTTQDGSEMTAADMRTIEPNAIVKDGARLDPAIPDDAVDVEINGSPVVAAHFAQAVGDLPLLQMLKNSIGPIRGIMGLLAPHIYISK